MFRRYFFLPCVLLVFVVGCAHDRGVTKTPATNDAPDEPGAIVEIAQKPFRPVVVIPPDGGENYGFTPIYFDFDRAEIRRDQRPAVEDAIPHIDGPTLLAGFCDERGTVAWNMALGQRRAEAVRKYLLARGIADDLLRTVSYGKERAQGHDEAGWAQDRKVTLTKE